MFEHKTVLLDEAVQGLNIREDGIYVDCTLGGAGHSRMILSQLENGVLIGIDQDDHALEHGRQTLSSERNKIHLIKSNFAHLEEVINDLGYRAVDGVLFDLGVSSPQLDEAERGFSYQHAAPLDMRMDRSQSRTAYEIVNDWDEEQLATIIYKYGEEKFSRRIARLIVEAREIKPIETTLELVEIIKNAIPAPARRKGPHPAKRTFQAIRIAVNDELGVFERAIQQAVQCLAPGGRVAVITFHSLEDRICKETFTELAKGCTCPPDFPVCVCHHEPTIRVINRKPILPSEKELLDNPRARSAKLRIAERI